MFNNVEECWERIENARECLRPNQSTITINQHKVELITHNPCQIRKQQKLKAGKHSNKRIYALMVYLF